MVKLNKWFSIGVIGMFCIEFLLLLFADFSKNQGTTKFIAILFFTLTYIWLTIPPILSLCFSKLISKNKMVLIIITVLDIGIFISGMPMFISYVESI